MKPGIKVQSTRISLPTFPITAGPTMLWSQAKIRKFSPLEFLWPDLIKMLKRRHTKGYTLSELLSKSNRHGLIQLMQELINLQKEDKNVRYNKETGKWWYHRKKRS